MREQHNHLISGDVPQLQRVNRLLNRLLEQQEDLRRELGECAPPVDSAELNQIRLLASELRHLSRVNYLLACRGAQYADFSASLLDGRVEPGRAG